MSNRKYLRIFSAEREGPRLYTSDETSSFQITTNTPSKQVRKIKLESAFIPMTYYNITSSNNQLGYNDGTNKSVTITPGNYSANSLALAIQTALGGVWGCTFNSITFKITFTATVGFILRFGTVTTNSIARAIGFSNTNVTLSAGTATGESSVYLSPTSVFICCPEIGAKFYSAASANEFGITYVIPVNVNGGEIVTYNPESNGYQEYDQSVVLPKKISAILLNEDFSQLNINNSEWGFIISFEEVNF